MIQHDANLEKLKAYREKFRSIYEQPLDPKRNMVRRPGKFRVLEVFTWTHMVTECARLLSDHWECYEPITLPKFDLLTEDGRQKARDYIELVDPDFLMIADPCGPFSKMNINMKQRTPEQVRRLHDKQEQSRAFLVFVEELVHYQYERHRAVVRENPATALSWKEAPMLAAFNRPGFASVITDMCMYDKIRPDNHMHVRKPTMLKGTREICEAASLRCDRSHDHSPIEGRMRIP